MGIIFILLTSAVYFGSGLPYVPIWEIFACHGAIATGTIIGGYKTIKTVGMRTTKLEPVHGFCAETSGAVTILTCSHFGIPISTTHTITGSIMGVGSTKNRKAVRWGVARNIVWAWILTIPAAAAVAAGTMKLLMLVMGT